MEHFVVAVFNVSMCCVLFAKNSSLSRSISASYTVSSVWLGSFLLCVCVFCFLFCFTCLKKGGNLILLPSRHHFFWPASIYFRYSARSRGGEKRSSYFCLVKYQHCVCICFVHLWFVSVCCSLASDFLLHPMNRNILVFCD